MVQELGLSSLTAEGSQGTTILQAMWHGSQKKKKREKETDENTVNEGSSHRAGKRPLDLARVEEASDQTHPCFPLSAPAHPTREASSMFCPYPSLTDSPVPCLRTSLSNSSWIKPTPLL